MKHLNPLRTLRLLTTLSAASSPVYVPLFVGLATPMVSTSTVSAQSQPTGSLPSLPATAPGANALPTAAPASTPVADSATLAREMLAKAKAALAEGRREVALQTLAQAHLAGPATSEFSTELIKARQEFMAKGVPTSAIESAVSLAIASSTASANNPMRSAQPTPPAPNALPLLPPAGGQAMATGVPTTLPPLPGMVAGGSNAAPNPLRDQAASFASQAKLALDRGDVAGARQLINQANALKVADKDFGPGQMKPWEVELAVRGREALLSGGVAQASATLPVANQGVQNASTNSNMSSGVQSGVYQPQKDGSKVAPASGVLTSYDAETSGPELYQQGISALSAGNKDAAMEKFKAAWQKKDQLDAPTLTQLKDKLTLLQGDSRTSGAPESIAALSAEDRDMQIRKQRLFSEVTGEIADAERLAVANQPLEALDKLRTLRQRIGQSDVSAEYRKSLLTRIDLVTANIENWVEQNKVAIELDQRNKQIENRMEVEATTRAKTDLQVQSLVDQYNDLIDSRRFPEAIEVAKKVSELKPGSEIASVMMTKAKIQARYEEYELIRSDKDEGFTRQMLNVDLASVPNDDNRPFSFPDQKTWALLTKNRLGNVEDSKMLPSERRIREALTEPFSGSFDKRPLGEVMNTIGEMFGIPVAIDTRSITEEGITEDQLISLDLRGNSIQLKSALNQILEPWNLTYAVRNELLTIQSKRFTQRENINRTYNVKDLVIPIPNFVSDNNFGMAGALQAAFYAQSNLASATVGPASNPLNASRVASIDPKSEVMAQIAAMPPSNGISPSLASALPGAMMPPTAGGLGGGNAMANYGDIMNLIRSTITPDLWDLNGGTSTMTPFSQNLTLIVSAPQETHEQIADLLKSLRALQDLQVTIEVRFIQLQDTFFERIGVDFDMQIDDNVRQLPNDDSGPSVAVGLASGVGTQGPTFTTDLDMTLGNNFSVTPPFGNPDINQATSFGVAILSDLELYFFLQASQGNSRQNVLNAPKVTMFDGQTASINDTAQRPFVTSFSPVVGDFAVAQRPIVVVLNEGTQMTVQSVVSQDRRFVRMTLNPQFTRLESTDRTFTFTGRRVTRTGTSILNPNGTPSGTRDDEEDIIEGTTVQQPTLGTTSIGTTVSVPDGGTILLGGIKRLREGRVERGAPILSKIPYLNRLFKNDAIGRETSTLMMTVTPHIIIPEEEEALMGMTTGNP